MNEAIVLKRNIDVVAEKMKAAASIVVVDSRGLTIDGMVTSKPSRKRKLS